MGTRYRITTTTDEETIDTLRMDEFSPMERYESIDEMSISKCDMPSQNAQILINRRRRLLMRFRPALNTCAVRHGCTYVATASNQLCAFQVRRDQPTNPILDSMNKKLEELTRELESEKEHEKQQSILKSINALLETVQKLQK